MVVNLLHNAIQHTLAGGAVAVALEARSGRRQDAVADGGSGIPEADRTRIFDRFVRLDEARGGAGTGLGLPIAKWITGGPRRNAHSRNHRAERRARSARDCECPRLRPRPQPCLSSSLRASTSRKWRSALIRSKGSRRARRGFIGAADGQRLLSGITSFKDFERAASGSSLLSSAVRGFFDNGGRRCSVVLIAATDPVEDALEALSGEPVSILCCPDENVFSSAASVMAEHCERRKDRFCILQSPQPTVPISTHQPPVRSSYAAYYHPWLIVPTPDRATTLAVPPGGHVAGVYAQC